MLVVYLQNVYTSRTKKDRKKQKTYTYCRLIQSYRVGKKIRQTVVLNLGKLADLYKKYHKSLANRVEQLVCGVANPLFNELPPEIESLAQMNFKHRPFTKITKVVT